MNVYPFNKDELRDQIGLTRAVTDVFNVTVSKGDCQVSCVANTSNAMQIENNYLLAHNCVLRTLICSGGDFCFAMFSVVL